MDLVGYETYDVHYYPDDITGDELDEEAWLLAVQHAESYGYYPEEWRPADLDDDSDENCYIEVYGSWQVYDEAKHAGLV